MADVPIADYKIAKESSGFKVEVIASSTLHHRGSVDAPWTYARPIGLLSLQLRYPRFILPQINTHSIFSKSSSSMRAIPVDKVIQQVLNDPVLPIRWGKNQKGMQAKEDFHGADVDDCIDEWLRLRDEAVKTAQALRARGVHKQLVNRVLEPWVWQHTIITSTEWDNFLNLREHDDAQPEIALLATLIRGCLKSTSTTSLQTIAPPKRVDASHFYERWHLPYLSREETIANRLSELGAIYVSAARCARVSYNNHEGTQDVIRDLELAKSLLVSGHMSPWQHVARPMTPAEMEACRMYVHTCSDQLLYKKEPMNNAVVGWDTNPTYFIGNYNAWMPYRKLIPGENVYMGGSAQPTIPPPSAFFLPTLRREHDHPL